MDIAEFLAACLDEDEAVARDASWSDDSNVWTAAEHTRVYDRGTPFERTEQEWYVVDSMDEAAVWHVRAQAADDGGVARLIARFDPARVLADIAAKRRILARHKPIPAVHAPGSWQLPTGFTGPFAAYCELCSDCADPDGGNNTYEPWPCPEVRDHAAPYADRPGFKPEWRIG